MVRDQVQVMILLQDFVQFEIRSNLYRILMSWSIGAILAVVVIYFDKLYPFKPEQPPIEVRRTWQLWAKFGHNAPYLCF